MKNKIRLLVLSSIGLMGCATGSFATTSDLSPFSDNLLIQFQNFKTENFLTAHYQPNNGVLIQGPTWLNTDSKPLIIISGDNKSQSGWPAIDLIYSNSSGIYEECLVTFTDGPMIKTLKYKGNITPDCSGLIFSGISQQAKHNYTLTIADGGL